MFWGRLAHAQFISQPRAALCLLHCSLHMLARVFWDWGGGAAAQLGHELGTCFHFVAKMYWCRRQHCLKRPKKKLPDLSLFAFDNLSHQTRQCDKFAKLAHPPEFEATCTARPVRNKSYRERPTKNMLHRVSTCLINETEEQRSLFLFPQRKGRLKNKRWWKSKRTNSVKP